MVKISASILSANFSKLGDEIKELEMAGADMIHLDVMDGKFVPHISFGADVIKSLRPYSSLPFDVHLMIDEPEKHIEHFAKAGADIITIHPETTKHLDRSLELIKSNNAKVGISLLPSSSPDVLEYVMGKIDLILVMTVNPGFAGQSFIKSQKEKIKQISKLISLSGRAIELSVDGGINNSTARDVVHCGASMLVSGSYIFSKDYKESIKSLKSED